jgi:hypothetical protein
MQINDGLTNAGVTPRFTYDYDEILKKTPTNPNGPEPARTNAMIAASDADYDLMVGWFGGISLSGYNLPISVSIEGYGWCRLGYGGRSHWDYNPRGPARFNSLPLSFRLRSYRILHELTASRMVCT